MYLRDVGKSTCFALCVDFVIIGNIALVGAEVDYGDSQRDTFELLHLLLVVIYLLELTIRLFAYRKQFFFSPLNLLDVVIVFLALVDVVQTNGNTWLWRSTLLRGSRLIRVWKIAKKSPPLVDLWLVIIGLARAARALAWLAVLLAVVGYAVGGAITGMVRHVESDAKKCTGKPGMYCLDVDEYFGSVSRSMFTLFQLATRSQWASHIVRPLALTSPLAAGCCVVFVAATSYGLLSVAVGLLVYSTVELARKHEDHGLHRAETEDKEIISDLADYFRASLAIEERTHIDKRELEEAMSVPQLAAAFKQLELPVADVWELFAALDRHKTGLILPEEFEAGCKMMKAPAKRFDVACLTATIGGHVSFVKNLEKRCDYLIGDMESMTVSLNSAFAELTKLVDPSSDTGAVPEVMLRRAGRIKNCKPPDPPRFTM